MTNIEHLRHGLPVRNVGDDCEATQTTDTSSGQTSKSISLSPELSVPSNSEAVQASIAAPAPVIAPVPMHHQAQAPSTAEAVSSHPSYSYIDSNPINGGPLPGGVEHGPELMGYSPPNSDRDATMTTRELAVHRWLVDSGYTMDPGFHYPAHEYGELMRLLIFLFISGLSMRAVPLENLTSLSTRAVGYMTTGYYAEAAMHQIPMPLSPFAEAALADRMSNLYNSNPYASLPPLYSRNESAESGSLPYPGSHPSVIPRSRESFVRSTNPTISQSVQIENEDAISSLLKLRGVSNENNQVEIQEDVGYDRGSSNNSRAPVSVQARRADTNWVMELFNSDFGGKEQNNSAEVTHAVLPLPEKQEEDSRTVNGSEGAGQQRVDRMSSVRRAVFSKKSTPGPPDLCSICHQKSPVFGKVKRFSYAELQDATDNFCEENYLAKGGYGTVYKGQLKGGQLVAVKQHKLSSSQGDEEFCAEVEVLSCAQHRNLVTLIGYCVEKQMRLLVYEYVCNGSLDTHLSGKCSPLSWTFMQYSRYLKYPQLVGFR